MIRDSRTHSTKFCNDQPLLFEEMIELLITRGDWCRIVAYLLVQALSVGFQRLLAVSQGIVTHGRQYSRVSGSLTTQIRIVGSVEGVAMALVCFRHCVASDRGLLRRVNEQAPPALQLSHACGAYPMAANF